jgi:tetratricopeptide (TPR) repeat protein
MRKGNKIASSIVAATVLATALSPGSALAQGVTDRVFSDVNAQTIGDCTTLRINFNVRVQIISSFPQTSGRELHVRITPLDAANVLGNGREALRVPEGIKALSSISYEGDDSGGPTLSLFFKDKVDFIVESSPDPQTVIIQISKAGKFGACETGKTAKSAANDGADEAKADIPIPSGLYVINLLSKPGEIGMLPDASKSALGNSILYDTSYEQDGQTWHRLRAGFYNSRDEALAATQALTAQFPEAWVVKVNSKERLQGVLTRRRDQGAGPQATQIVPKVPLTVEQTEQMQVLIKQSEDSIKSDETDRAIQLLTQALAIPENDQSPRALELLGLMRERKGQSAHAVAEYEDYLRRYPEGEASDRVRQRLSALKVGGSDAPTELRSASGGSAAGSADDWRWGLRGSVSQFYYRDQSTTRFLDSTRIDPNNVDTIEAINSSINQNQLLSTADITVTGGNDRSVVTMRTAGSYSKNFDKLRGDQKSLSALYLDFSDKKLGVSVRLGRQTRNSAGVFGRFDGGLLGLQIKPRVKINLVAGFPVSSSRVTHIDQQRKFYGASLDLGARNDKLQGTVYWFDQRTKGGFYDRQSVGGEVRFLTNKFNGFGLVDYDVHFKKVNLALMTLNYTFPDRSNFSVTADYRQSPLLTTQLALIGQRDLNATIVNNLTDLNQFYTKAELKQLAIDRSQKSKTITVNYSRPITGKLQANLDFTAAHTGSSPASGGVFAVPSTGTEFYYGAQLIGSGLLMSNDIYILSGRMSDSQRSRSYTLDLNARLPVTRKFRFSPRARYGIRDDKLTNGKFTQFQPSVRFNYYPIRGSELELEAGANFSRQTSTLGMTSTRTSEKGFLINLGYRLDF